MQGKQGFLHNLGFLSLGQIASQLLNVWILVFLAGALGPHHFGIVQIGVAFMAYALITAEWGMMSLGIRDISRLPNAASILGYSRSQTGLLGLQAAAVLVVGLVILPLLPFTRQDPWVFRIYLAAVVPQVFMHSWIATGMERMAWVGAARTGLSVTYALLILLVVPHLSVSTGFGATHWVPAAYVLAFSISNLLLVIPTRRWFGQIVWPRLPSWSEARNRWRQAAPIGGGIIVLRVLLNIDLVLLGLLSTPAVAGQYAAASRIIFLLVVAVEVLWGALLPRLSRLAAHSTDAFRAEFNLTLSLVLAALLPIGLGGVLLGPDLLTFLLREGYPLAGQVFQVLAVSYTLLAVGTFLGKALIAEDRQDLQFRPILISAVVAVAANLWLIPRLGGLGAGWGMLIAHALLLGMLIVVQRRNFTRRLAWGTLGVVPALGALAIAVSLLSDQHILLRIAAGGGAYAVAAAFPVLRLIRSAAVDESEAATKNLNGR
jgi:O-antigen/teichoic acid export membrane protein